MSCRPSPWIYTHADMNSLIFHSTGRAAGLYRKNTFLQKKKKKKKSLETAVRQHNNRIIHGPVFPTFDCLATFSKFTPALAISLLFFLSPHIFLSPSVSVPPFVNVLFITPAPSSLFSPFVLFSHCVSPVLCQVRRLVEAGVSDSCWSVCEVEISPALPSAVCSTVWPG